MTPTYVRAGRCGASPSPPPVILISDFSQWRLLPSSQVVGQPTAHPAAARSRPGRPTRRPQNVGGDLKLATFNVLNFFPTDGDEYVAMPAAATPARYFTDRAGNQITNNACGNPTTSGQRPAWCGEPRRT